MEGPSPRPAQVHDYDMPLDCALHRSLEEVNSAKPVGEAGIVGALAAHCRQGLGDNVAERVDIAFGMARGSIDIHATSAGMLSAARWRIVLPFGPRSSQVLGCSWFQSKPRSEPSIDRMMVLGWPGATPLIVAEPAAPPDTRLQSSTPSPPHCPK